MSFSQNTRSKKPSPLSGGLPSDNGGRKDKTQRELGLKSPSGGAAPTPRSGTRRGAEHGGSHATSAETVQPSALADGWAAQHCAELGEREKRARLAALRSGKPWTLHADEQTRAILADCPERNISTATAAKYRRAYDNLRANGQTAIETATTRAHWDFLRTACRYCMEQDAKAWRAASERARKRGNLESAQRRTERAFRLAAVLDEQFMQPTRRTWANKAAELKAKGERIPSKSKRLGGAPAPDIACAALLAGNRRGSHLIERHAERLAALALFGFRPAEMLKGVRLAVEGKNGKRLLTAQIMGAKVSDKRGQELRLVGVPVEGVAAEALAAIVEANGGKWMLGTSYNDYRSLNRALKSGAAVSCYSFRHQVGSELKEAVSSGAMGAEEVAQAMGHRSTESLSYYGTRSAARGGRGMKARASNDVRAVPVTYAAKAKTRTKAKAQDGMVRFAPKPQAQPSAARRAAISKPVRPLARGPKPPR